MVDPKNPAYWEEPLEGENDLWFNRFRIYLLMAKPRSFVGAYRLEDAQEMEAGQDDPLKRNGRVRRLKKPPISVPASWRNAIKKYQWVERARAYERHKLKQDEEALREWEIELRKKMQLAAEDNFRIADEMAKRSLEVKVRITEKGEVQEIPAHWTARDIATFRLAGAELGNKAVRRPEIDLIQAVELLVAEGIFDGDVLDAATQGYDGFKEVLRRAIGRGQTTAEE